MKLFHNIRRFLRTPIRLPGRRESDLDASETEAEEAEKLRQEAESEQLLEHPTSGFLGFLRGARRNYTEGSVPRERLDQTIQDLEKQKRS